MTKSSEDRPGRPPQGWPSPTEVAAVVQLAAKQRFDYFLKRVVDREAVFTLRAPTGFCLGATTVDGQTFEVMPVWPAEAYAVRCAKGAWADASPVKIELPVFLERWIPGLQRDARLLSVFPTLDDEPVIEAPRVVEAALRRHAAEWYGDE